MTILSPNLILGKDINGYSTFVIGFSPLGVDVTLTADAAQSTVVPPNVNVAIFGYSSGASVFVDGQQTAVIPPGTFTATTGDINPQGRFVTPGQTLSFISADTAWVKVSYYYGKG